MAAFGAAVALGAEEVEFDVWSTTDGVLVSSHDSTLERVSNGVGKIYEKSYAELMQLDFGVKYGEEFAGLKIVKFEDILRQFGGRVIMNIHVKIWDNDFADDKLDEIVALLKKYDCEQHMYFMTNNDRMLREVKNRYPQLKVCVCWDGFGREREPMSIVERSIALGAHKVQFYKPHFDKACIDKAHAHGIICNVCWADDPEEAKRYFDMGIDTVLTNKYLSVYNGVKALWKKN